MHARFLKGLGNAVLEDEVLQSKGKRGVRVDQWKAVAVHADSHCPLPSTHKRDRTHKMSS